MPRIGSETAFSPSRMTSLRFFAICVVVLATFGLQGASGSVLPEKSGHENVRSISKRSIMGLSQYFPWFQQSKSSEVDASASTSDSSASASESGFAKFIGLRSATESHNVSKRTIEELKPVLEPVVEKVERILGALPSHGLFSHSQAKALDGLAPAAIQPTIMLIHHKGPLTLTREIPALTTTAAPDTTTPAPTSPASASAAAVVVQEGNKTVTAVASATSNTAGSTNHSETTTESGSFTPAPVTPAILAVLPQTEPSSVSTTAPRVDVTTAGSTVRPEAVTEPSTTSGSVSTTLPSVDVTVLPEAVTGASTTSGPVSSTERSPSTTPSEPASSTPEPASTTAESARSDLQFISDDLS